MVEPVDPSVVWTWIIRGLGGLVSIINRMAQHTKSISSGHVNELDDLSIILYEIVEELKSKRK